MCTRIENRIYTCHNILLTFQTFVCCGVHDALLAPRERDVGREKKMISNIEPSLSEIESRRAWKYPGQIRLLAADCCRRWDLTAALQHCSLLRRPINILISLNISDLGYPNTRKEIFPKQYCSKCNSGIYLCLKRLRGGDPKWLKTFYALLKHFRAIENCMHSISKQMWSFNQFAFPLTHLLLTFWRSLFYVGSVSAMHCNGRGLVAHCEASKCIYWAKVDVMLVILSNWIVFKSKYRKETF